MRESRTFAERTKVLKTDEVKKRYFLVFEGDSTEKIYFEALENPQVTTKRRYTEHELRKLLPGYSKGKYNAEVLVANISHAVCNAEKFCQDEGLLISELGTNVNRLILLMRGIF